MHLERNAMSNPLVFHHREFERDVRKILNKPEGQITDSDVSVITQLDCTNYTFDHNDINALKHFINLEKLSIEINDADISFLSSFPKLKGLDLICINSENEMDLNVISCLRDLEYLFVSGGDISDIDFISTNALTGLTKLTDLSFHEFGTVDLSFLNQMPWIEEFLCGYAYEVLNIESIGKLKNLESLTLIDIEIDNLDFLDSLPDTMSLELCGLELQNGIDMEKLKRFSETDIDEITVGGKRIV